ncbi:MAG: hypothetical protein ABI687_08325, partial [Flavitalea sp.]
MASRKTVIFFLFLVVSALSWKAICPTDADDHEKIERLFRLQLKQLQNQLDLFKIQCQKKAGMTSIKESFKKARLRYKKAAVLLEYYYPNERRFINGPDLERAVEDNPAKIIAPHGFQVMERIIYNEVPAMAYPLLEDELSRLQTVLEAIQRQPNLSYKFKKETVIDAVKAALIKLVAKGITGFDSPIALYALPEASATLSGIQDILSIFQAPPKMSALVNAAIVNLQANNHFDSFDRLGFITRFADP